MRNNNIHDQSELVSRVLEMMREDKPQPDIVDHIVRSGVQPQAAIALYDQVKNSYDENCRQQGYFRFIAGSVVLAIGLGLYAILPKPINPVLEFILFIVVATMMGSCVAMWGIYLVLRHPGSTFGFFKHLLIFAAVIGAIITAGYFTGLWQIISKW